MQEPLSAFGKTVLNFEKKVIFKMEIQVSIKFLITSEVLRIIFSNDMRDGSSILLVPFRKFFHVLKQLFIFFEPFQIIVPPFKI